MVLTVGSPNLAAYSLVLTVLNGRWVSRLFAPYTYPNTRNAVYILDSLQQAPLVVQSEGGLLASLVVLPENDEWWNETVVWLDYTHTWTISSISSIAWVIIAYVFTIIDAFSGNLLSAIRAHGEGVGSVWLWLLPIVIGWLQISPKCESKRLAQALKRANEHAYVATIDHGPALASTVSGTRAIGLQRASGALAHGDEKCFCPVNNYARVFSWAQNVETISEVFRAASARTNQHHPVNSQIDWVTCSKEKIHPSNRRGDMEQVISYCNPKLESRSRWGRGVWSRCLTASVVAFFLQWGTTGAAVIVSWLTPTRGLGCRSGAYLIYGIGSTLVWAMLLLSSIFAHYSTLEPPEYLGHRKRVSAQVARRISSMLRRTGKFIAACNAIWIVLSCLFQFSNVFDRCFCNSSVFGLKGKAFDILIFLGDDVASMRTAWIGGVILAAGTAVGFVVFVGLFINPPFPAPNE
ncbi:hypothetical protein BD779DRAFT_1676514 [Infundibulicybe gibba]|nr:hypothetical protein BD779DRAFT_1676514 [Infundibulicybe gibba]